MTLTKAIKFFGKEKQLIKSVEELSELQKEICKELIGEGSLENIAEEMADCRIMMSQIELIYGSSFMEKVELKMNQKIKRLKSILDKKENKK
jgi:NTP pyrophosphatase (non-canonical NTP hydrolase)